VCLVLNRTDACLDPKIWKGGFGPPIPNADPVFSDISGTRYSPTCPKVCPIVLIVIKINNHLEQTELNVPFTNPINAKKCVLKDIMIFEILFRFSAE